MHKVIETVASKDKQKTDDETFNVNTTDAIPGEGLNFSAGRARRAQKKRSTADVRIDSEDAVPTDIARMQGQEGSLGCRVFCLNGQTISTAK